MQISARADYGLRALAELAARQDRSHTVTELAAAQGMPARFLQNILLQLRRRGLLQSQRGVDGGYRLARPAAEITVAEVLRALEGPLAGVRGALPEDVEYAGTAEPIAEVWLAVRVCTRRVLECVTLEDIASGRLPAAVSALARDARDP